MSRHVLASLIVVAVTAASANAQVQPGPGVTVSPERTSKVPLPAPILQPACAIDPALVGLRVQNARKNADGTFEFQVAAELRNVGTSAYRSRAGQQTASILQAPLGGPAPTTLTRTDFPELAAGASRTLVATVRNWRLTVEFPPNFDASIVYDPDILRDGNTQNDDCNARNNTARLTGEAVNQVLSRL